jgi:hypothetical protein
MKRQASQVFTVQPQQIECTKIWFAAAVEQFIKLRFAILAETHNLSVNYCVLDLNGRCDFRAQLREELVRVTVARYEIAFAILYICERAKAIVFDLKDPIGMVKRLRPLRQPHRS